MAVVTVPSFQYSGIYYASILQDLLVWLRNNVPEITDEDPNEPFIQLLRAFALTGHRSNVLLDHVALEALLPTARLREVVRGHLALIGYALAQPSPATADAIFKLASPPTSAITLPARTQALAPGDDATAEVVYETTADLTVGPGDVLDAAREYKAGTLTWTDRTIKVNGSTSPFVLWGAVAQDGDALYLGHSSVLWDQLDVTYDTKGDAALWAADGHVWEYYDGQTDDATPSAVTSPGAGALDVDLTSLLGATKRAGAIVRVRSLLTGGYEDVACTWDGTKNMAATGALGQAVLSLTATDYVVGVEWKELPGLTETVDGGAIEVAWTLPETVARRWQQVAVDGATAYWLRLRVVDGIAGATGAPVWDRARIDRGDQYAKTLVTQGATVVDSPAGSTTGLAGYSVLSGQGDVIAGTLQVQVDEGGGLVLYTAVADFLSSTTTDRHYTADYDEDGRAVVTFGNGTNGKIPPAGADNVVLQYRVGGAVDGNVGAGALSVSRALPSLVSGVTNPRAATGWQPAEGSTDAGLAQAKRDGPASLRTLKRVLTADDAEDLAVAFVAASGAKPVARAIATEGKYGAKTLGVMVAGAAGAAVPAELLTELDEYYNGDPLAGTSGVVLLNTQATSYNYTPRGVDVTATVKGTAAAATIKAALEALLQPLGVDGDGSYLHDPGGTIYRERLIAEIFNAAPGKVKNVTLTLPAADVVLGADELPRPGAIAITVVP